MNIGAGRIVPQELPRIDEAIAADELTNAPPLARLISKLSKSGAACHLVGLISPGGVHSHQRHIVAIARSLAAASVRVHVHLLLDGRDTPPRSGMEYVREFESAIEKFRSVRVATVGGRYFGMDRDHRWDRVERAYRTLMSGECPRVRSVIDGIKQSYSNGVGDEFMNPVAVCEYTGMKDGDGLLAANFRADRIRQLLTALVDPEFKEFPCRKGACMAASRSYSTNDVATSLYRA